MTPNSHLWKEIDIRIGKLIIIRPAFGKLRQENGEFNAILGLKKIRLCQNIKAMEREGVKEG